jgi:hypothetical protein
MFAAVWPKSLRVKVEQQVTAITGDMPQKMLESQSSMQGES